MQGRLFSQQWVSVDGFTCDDPRWLTRPGPGGWQPSAPLMEAAQVTVMMASAVILDAPALVSLCPPDQSTRPLRGPLSGKRLWVCGDVDGVALPPGARALCDSGQTVEALLTQGLDLWLWGGPALLAQMMRDHQLAELELFTLPIVLGKGTRWLDLSDRPAGQGLDLIACEAFPCGTVRTHYACRSGV